MMHKSMWCIYFARSVFYSEFAFPFSLFLKSMMIFESRLHIWSHGTHDLTDCHQNTVMRLYSNIWFGHGREEWLTALSGNLEIITGLEQGVGLRETLRTNYRKRCRKCAHGICLQWDWITGLRFKPYLVCLPFYTVCTWSEKKLVES